MIDKTMIFNEDFLKESVLVQVRTLLDKRNLKFDIGSADFNFAS